MTAELGVDAPQDVVIPDAPLGLEYGYRHSLQDERFKQDRHGLRKDGRTFIQEPVLPGIGSRDGSATALLLTTEDLAEQKRIIRRWLVEQQAVMQPLVEVRHDSPGYDLLAHLMAVRIGYDKRGFAFILGCRW